jgi:hypothetical protein
VTDCGDNVAAARPAWTWLCLNRRVWLESYGGEPEVGGEPLPVLLLRHCTDGLSCPMVPPELLGSSRRGNQRGAGTVLQSNMSKACWGPCQGPMSVDLN